MEGFIESIFNYLLENYALYMVVVMGVLMTIIFFALNLVKKPIKKLTSKIKNEQLRHLANKSIIVLSFAFSILFWLILHCFVPKYFAFNGCEIFLTGALPVLLYALLDGIINQNKAKEIANTVKEIVSDGEVDKEEIKEVINELSEHSAENELDDLLK